MMTLVIMVTSVMMMTLDDGAKVINDLVVLILLSTNLYKYLENKSNHNLDMSLKLRLKVSL